MPSFVIRHSNRFQQFPALCLHSAGFFGGILMVIAEQMQDTVDQQFIESALPAQIGFLCFSGGGIHRYHHITQKMRAQMGKFALAHGKGDDVGRPLAVKIIFVERRDLRVIHEENGNFAVRKVQGA